jgi:hypothetical protein
MKNPDRTAVSRLDALPNIGPAIASDLQRIGIHNPQQLVGKDPFELYESLCRKTGQKHDLCLLDVFMSAVDFMQGGEPRTWWSFTAARKAQLDQRNNKGNG